MFKLILRKNLIKSILVLFLGLEISGCSLFKDGSMSSEFNTSPDSYKQATVVPNVVIPKYIANNIDKQPLYLIPNLKSQSSQELKDEKISIVPPTLIGQMK